ncbi:MAG TPA: cache domain-containing protein [Xanthobacteraceae bacterium]|nr:cache domain-containing protein [Xanthobacteraceae bacterium]
MAPPSPDRRGGIVRRYFLIFAALIGGSLAAGLFVELAFRFQEARLTLQSEHQRMAELAALRIENYVEDIAQTLRIAAPPRGLKDGRLSEDYLFNLRTLIRNTPAIRDAFVIGLDGHEQFRESRIAASVPNTAADHSADPFFVAARDGETYYGPVKFPNDSLEPRIRIAVPIEPFAGDVAGVLAADVNVRYIWDVVQDIHVGKSGYAYVVSNDGILIAHPDLHLVLQHKDLSDLPQITQLRDPDSGESGTGEYPGLSGARALVAYQRIPSLGWTVLVERPLMEAYGPALLSLGRIGGIFLALCVLAFAAAVRLRRRVVKPIEALRQGAVRLESGDLDARLSLKTGDEFEDLAEDFNRMAARLQEAHAGLEHKVAERTQALEQSLGEVKALSDTMQTVSASLDLQKVLQTIVVHATELSKSDGGVIYEFDEDAQVFRFRAGHLLRPEFVTELVAAPPTLLDSIIGRAAVLNEPQNIPDGAEPTAPHSNTPVLAEGYRSMLAVPMTRGGRVLGGIVLGRKVAGGYSDEEIDLLRTFANGCTIAIEHARLFYEVGRKNTALQLASQHKSQFLANMSHELRTPMNAILGFTDLMLDGIYGDLNPRLRKPIDQLQVNGQHLLRLINDVLDLSKIEAGRLELSLAEYNVDEIVEALQAAAYPLAQAKGLAFGVSSESRIGNCYGDSKRMFQVLLNITGNAIKFTRYGGVNIRVARENGDVHYAVRDTGIGIPTEELGSIFEEFGRGDPAIAKEFAGTGLGLTIAKRFVTMHGGRIWAESTFNVGSTFHIVVPRRVTAASVMDAALGAAGER